MRFRGRGNESNEITRRLAWQLSVAFVCVAVATGIRFFLDPWLLGVPFITFFPAVAVAAYAGGTSAGILTTLSGGIIASYFWVPPVRQWALSEQGMFTVGTYFLLSGLILFLIHRLHVALERAHNAELQSNLYAREMAHRISNLVALVQAVSSMTFKGDGSANEQRQLFSSRLTALSHALTAPLGRDGAQDLNMLLHSVLEPFGERIAIEVPASGLAADTASSLALIFHELATNAVKYGALSSADGSVELQGIETADGTHLRWIERGGPTVHRQPTRRGFGSRLLERSMKPEAGEVQVAFEPEGLTARIFLKK